MREGDKNMKTALVHHWLVAQRGGERLFDALLELFPDADVFTLVYDAAAASPALRQRRVRTSFLQRMPRATRWYPFYLPLFPRATESLDIAGYDLIVSSDAATLKGVRARPGAVHICYCHTPMRYVWCGYETYRRSSGPLGRLFLPVLAERLRRWDFEAAQRVTHFVANSWNVAERIRRYYCRESTVIYPPVDTQFFVPDSGGEQRGKYFLAASQLVAYKRIDLIVEAFNRCGLPLVVIGEGNERARLERAAKPNIRFLGPQPAPALRSHMQAARAFVFAGEEDFGIVMAEALACGTPVIAFGRGGATEIVEHGRTGILFQEQTPDSLIRALWECETLTFPKTSLRDAALRFARGRFLQEFAGLVDRLTQGGTELSSICRAH
jgi:glycosyltransferase involved in cell wall biosynthesis